MKTMSALFLLGLLSSQVFAEGVNERNHPEPGSQAKINRVIAQAWATQAPPADNIAVYRNVSPNTVPINTQGNSGNGVNLGLSVGSVAPGRNGQAPRENNVVTRDNIVICLHCRGN